MNTMNHPRILIVDDKESNIRALESMIKDSDIDVELISDTSPISALALAGAYDFCLAIIDVNMPEMDGFELSEKLRAQERSHNLPIILMTATYDSQPNFFKGFQSGAVDYLVKPVAPQVVYNKVSIFVALYQQRLELEIAKKEVDEANKRLEHLSITDQLTGIGNRMSFDNTFHAEWERAKRDKTPLTIIMFDIDFFKQYNDRYGHQAGDSCLKIFAKKLSECYARTTDFVARYGGEEFVALLPNTAMDESFIIENCIDKVHNLKHEHEDSRVSEYLTVSAGACVLVPTKNISKEQALNEADKALYHAKEKGRNTAIVVTL